MHKFIYVCMRVHLVCIHVCKIATKAQNPVKVEAELDL